MKQRANARVELGGRAAQGELRTLPVALPDDTALAHAIIAGSDRAAALAWDRFAPLVRTLAWKALGPSADIDDLVQDVFMTLFRRAPDLREPAALSSFVVGISVRCIRFELRKRRLRRWLSFLAPEELPELETPEVDHAARAGLRATYRVLDKLDADSRLAFVLRHAQGLELTEIAEALECSLATAKRRLAKAEARLTFHARREPELVPFLGAATSEEGEP
ncbi:MAG: sigma-70 family RNA polymerase sigma factor [Polyangiaceae bacterium]